MHHRLMYNMYIYIPLPWQRAGYWWGIFTMYSWLSDGFTHNHRVHGMDICTKGQLAAWSPWTMGYKIVIAHELGLPPEYNYSASASPRIIFWLSSLSQGYNYYIIMYIWCTHVPLYMVIMIYTDNTCTMQWKPSSPHAWPCTYICLQ